MAAKLSRRKLAQHAADQIIAGVKPEVVLRSIAAHLIEARRTREQLLVVRAIEDELAARGVVIATVTTAHPLTDSLQRAVTEVIDAPTVHLRKVVDSTVIGGVRIETPGAQLDSTIQHKLLTLRRAKI